MTIDDQIRAIAKQCANELNWGVDNPADADRIVEAIKEGIRATADAPAPEWMACDCAGEPHIVSCDCGGFPHGRGCSLVLHGLIEAQFPHAI